ncbi:MAG: DUF3990 domain-containing protein [Coriobacteriales bacterium]|jgi:hypothetical protein|nr:DUF3990 domain-containing protein [Coriobacteriales bacterium]
MILFHGSILEIRQPDVAHSKENLDFGKGFYLTTHLEQARRWARRKALRTGGKAIVNRYELEDDLSDYKELRFFSEDEDWVKFVCACRRGGKDYEKYDLIIGGVADDKVFAAVDMYFRGIWDIDRTISELKFYKANDQICLVSQELIDQKLHFVVSEEVT